jgi:hypothetical protein
LLGDRTQDTPDLEGAYSVEGMKNVDGCGFRVNLLMHGWFSKWSSGLFMSLVWIDEMDDRGSAGNGSWYWIQGYGSWIVWARIYDQGTLALAVAFLKTYTHLFA